MKQWDIYSYPFREGAHPAVILSPDEICWNQDFPEVNVLFCATHRPINRSLKSFEVLLDESDGLSWRTAVRCHKLLFVPKNALRQHCGSVRSCGAVKLRGRSSRFSGFHCNHKAADQPFIRRFLVKARALREYINEIVPRSTYGGKPNESFTAEYSG
jgi:mRNA-degrading endonuclease toxin of MazEF toxin-antitoxin module